MRSPIVTMDTGKPFDSLDYAFIMYGLNKFYCLDEISIK